MYDVAGFNPSKDLPAAVNRETPKKTTLGVTGQIKSTGNIAPTYTKGGKMAQQQKAGSVNRLFLSTSSDPRFSVGVVDVKQTWFASKKDRLSKQGKFVKIDVYDENEGPKTVAVGVKELAQRLHLSSKQIRQEAKAGRLEAFLEEKQETEFSHLPEIIHEYEIIFTQYEDQKGELVNPDTKEPAQITKKQLMKVVRTALLNQTQSPFAPNAKKPSPTASITLQSTGIGEEDPITAGVKIKVSSHGSIGQRSFVAIKEPGRSLTIVQDPKEGEFVAVGSYGAVHRIQNISQLHMPIATKLTKQDLSPKEQLIAASVIADGAVITRSIHTELNEAGLPSEGIMSAPYAVVDIRGVNNAPVVSGWLGKDYNGGSAFEFSRSDTAAQFTPREFATAAIGVCEGLSGLLKIGRPHRDLKTENLLVSFDLTPSTRSLKLVIGDLDTCKKKEDVNFTEGEFKNHRVGISTSVCFPQDDLKSLLVALDKHKKLAEEYENLPHEGLEEKKNELENKMSEIMDELFAIYDAKDKFAMAATIHDWLTGGILPYEVTEVTNFPDFNEYILYDTTELLKPKGYTEDFINGFKTLLENMLNPDWKQRTMTMDEFTQQFSALIEYLPK